MRVILATGLVVLLGCAPTIVLTYRQWHYPSDLWRLMATTGNRYLFFLAFFPIAAWAVFQAGELISRASVVYLLHRRDGDVGLPILRPEQQAITLFLAASAVASLLTLWNFHVGNRSPSDLQGHFGRVTVAATDTVFRDVIFGKSDKNLSVNQDVALSLADLALDETQLKTKVKDPAFALAYLKGVERNRIEFLDSALVLSDVLATWALVFTFAVLLGTCILAAPLLGDSALIPSSQAEIVRVRSLLPFAFYVMAVWLVLRYQAVAEINALSEATSGERFSSETVDLFLATGLLVLGAVLISNVRGSAGMALPPFVPLLVAPGAMILSLKDLELARRLYGSGLPFKNFLAYMVLWLVILASASVVSRLTWFRPVAPRPNP